MNKVWEGSALLSLLGVNYNSGSIEFIKPPEEVYEPMLDAPEFFGSEVTHDLEAFKAGCDVIVANRWSDELTDVADKVYAMDLVKRN